MKTVKKGASVSVTTAFKRRGVPLAFGQPPVWSLRNEAGKMLMNGVAVQEGSRWSATFTVPTAYVVDGGSETLEIEFIGYSGNNEYSRSKEVELLDEAEEFRSNSIVYNSPVTSKLRDSIILPYDRLEYIIVSVATPFNTQLYQHPTISNPTFASKTTQGYEYKFDLGSPDLALALKYTEPVQLIVQAKPVGADPVVEIHPVYVLTGANAGLVNELQQYLDKARLTEIDKTLQWSLDEYLHYLNMGIAYINGFGDPATFWSVASYPSSLRVFVMYAAAYRALNARYLAEGFNAFQFTGLNTTLEFDRRPAMEYKMGEIQSFLDSRLPAARAAAVRAYGIGSPPADSGQVSNSAANSGVLGLSLGPTTNSYGWSNRNRIFRRF